jgi:2-polyprenyl-3-methyl-5-hydroxy-6-metoxy-1,4-benzoquinol methylase
MPTLSFGPCARRSFALEPIEEPSISDKELNRLLSFIDVLNHWTGGNDIALRFLESCAERWLPGDTITFLDVGCLRGDLSRSLVDWGRTNKINMRVLAIDHNPRFIELAKTLSLGYPEITFDARRLDDPVFLLAQQFDYVVSLLALHRESNTDARAMLKKISMLAKRGVMVNDWLRDLRALLWVSVFSWFTRDDAIRYGAQVAIKKGFTMSEVKKMADDAGLAYMSLQKNFGYRFTLAGERGLVSSPRLVSVPGLAT